MQISSFTIQKLARILNGDSEHTPYLSGPDLVRFANELGYREVYGEGFPSRWKYVESKLKEMNGSPKLARFIELIINPRSFFESKLDPKRAIEHINELLSYDGYSLVESGKEYRIVASDGVEIEAESLAEVENDYVSEQIRKCDLKIASEDFDGAITNARTLVETVIVDILRVRDPAYEHRGDLTKAYRAIKKVLRIEDPKNDTPESIKQVLSGLEKKRKKGSNLCLTHSADCNKSFHYV